MEDKEMMQLGAELLCLILIFGAWVDRRQGPARAAPSQRERSQHRLAL